HGDDAAARLDGNVGGVHQVAAVAHVRLHAGRDVDLQDAAGVRTGKAARLVRDEEVAVVGSHAGRHAEADLVLGRAVGDRLPRAGKGKLRRGVREYRALLCHAFAADDAYGPTDPLVGGPVLRPITEGGDRADLVSGAGVGDRVPGGRERQLGGGIAGDGARLPRPRAAGDLHRVAGPRVGRPARDHVGRTGIGDRAPGGG